jgi:hypothetical protein
MILTSIVNKEVGPLEWFRVFAILGLIFFIIGISQAYLLKKVLKNIDKEQVMPDEFADQWEKRLSLGNVFIILGAILGGIATLLLDF